MPKSIFGRLLVTYISVLVFSIILTVTILNIFLSAFLSDEKVKLLEQTGDRISSLMTFYVEKGESSLLIALVNNVVKNSSISTNSLIWFATPEGKIIFISKETIPEDIYKKFVTSDGSLKLPSQDQYKGSFSGAGNVETGDFHGLFENTGMSWVTVVRPFYYEGTPGKKDFLGAVYLSTPLPELNKAQQALWKYIAMTLVISILITILLTYFVSRRISRPLINIKHAAKNISEGKFNKIENISNDEIGELSNSFNEMAESLKKLENARRTFVANVSHELRTPLTSIGGFVDGMIDGTIPQENFTQYLKIVSEETKRLTSMANDILELAKVESGDLVCNFTKFGINELIRRTIIKLEVLFTSKELQINILLAENEIFVLADIALIERVLINLLHNAVKFMNENGELTVKTDISGQKAVISVADTGIGIPENERDAVWDRFYKADKSRGSNKAGAGLGLSIVKNIIDGHNQKISIESNANDIGVKFVFTLEIASD